MNENVKVKFIFLFEEVWNLYIFILIKWKYDVMYSIKVYLYIFIIFGMKRKKYNG